MSLESAFPHQTTWRARDLWALALASLLMGVAFLGMAALHDLRQHMMGFLGLYGLSYVGYAIAIGWLVSRPQRLAGLSRRRALVLVVGMAVLLRLILLFTTPPTLSDDVYRYIWDGRLANAGLNPYAYAVNSPQLDWLDSALRRLVNHSWMASPYLPAAQALFAVVYRLAPENPLAFQVAAMVLDLLTGCLVMDLLRHLRRPLLWALVYLWNPLVMVEAAHGAHVDSWMIFCMTAAVWAVLTRRSRLLSMAALAVGTLVKPIPALLLPLLGRRWGWRLSALYILLLCLACWPFAAGAGWGLTGPLDGTGVFGAARIYAAQWNYNSSIYHWLEVTLSGVRTPGPVPVEVAGPQPILVARWIVTLGLAAALLATWRLARTGLTDVAWVRLAIVPLGSYLLLATTVHPWYVAVVLPFLPFALSQTGEEGQSRRERGTPFALVQADCLGLPRRYGPGVKDPTGGYQSQRWLWPWLYLAASIVLSYWTYRDPANLREYDWVRLIEYVPFYLLLSWAAWPAIVGVGRSGAP